MGNFLPSTGSKKPKELIKLGSIKLNDTGGGGSVSAASIEDYDKLTVNDFLVVLVSGYTHAAVADRRYSFSVNKKYNPTNGMLSVTGGTMVGSSYMNTDIYVLGRKK